MGPHPAVAAIRLAVRRVLHDVLHTHPAPTASTSHSAPTAPTATAPTRPRRSGPGQAAAAPGPSSVASPHAPPEPPPRGALATARPAPARLSAPPEPAADVALSPSRAPSSGPSPASCPDGPLVLVACSGGADSMALASALAFEAPRVGVRAGAVTVDHGLQPGSDERAREVAERLGALGLEPVEVTTVTVGRAGGPEAAARTARYAALDAAAERLGAAAVLLGHTRDDQAETVLLGLARGSGIRSLSGMAAVSGSLAPGPEGADGDAVGKGDAAEAPGRRSRGGAGHRYRRPFLAIDRQTTRTACLEQAIPVWDDPHNTDPSFTRSRVRHEALPVLEKALGRGVVEALARTARLSRDDADALDAWAEEARRAATRPDGALEVAALCPLPPAVRRRVLRRAAIAAGAPAGSLFARHIEETDRLITAWRGQRPLNLPGRVEASRQGGRLVLQQANG